MSNQVRVVNWVLRRVFQTICRIDVKELRKVPAQGPLILVGNHINFLEAPVLLAHLDNPCVTGIAKEESWDNPLFNYLFNQWQLIPIDREGVDREALRKSFEALAQGKILAISPEGTRSINGCLLQGKPGVIALALRSKAPLLPIAFYGYENFWANFKRLRRTDFHVVLGKPFRLDTGRESLSREGRQAATDEIMYKIAELLPERYRGYYSTAERVEYKYVVGI